MPKTTFEFEVSTDKPKAIVSGPDYLTKPIASLFRHKGLTVHTNPSSQPARGIDYIVDISGNKDLINLAVETGAKYLRLVVSQQSFKQQENINWRILQTDFLVGEDLPNDSLMAQIIKSAIKNQTIFLPSSKTKIFPLHIKDLAQACWQALIIPNTSKKHFLALGQPVSSQRLGTYLENLGQTTKGVERSPNLKVKNYSPDQIESSYQNLNWQPKLSWQEAIKKTFQAMWTEESKKISQPQPKPEKEPEIEPEPDHHPPAITESKPKAPEKSEEEIIIVEEPVEEEIKEYKNQVEEEKNAEEIASQFKQSTQLKESQIAWWQPVLLSLFLLIGFIISVWFKPTLRLGLGYWQMKRAYAQILNQNWEQSLTESQKAKKNFFQAEQFLENSTLSNLFFGYQNILAKGAELGRKTASSAETAVPLLKNSLQLSESILKNKSFDQQEGINQLKDYHKTLDYQLKEIQALLKGSWPGIPGRWQNTPQKLTDKFNKFQENLFQLNQILTHLPWIIGMDGQKKTFLVLLQNNMELRPTGGFIGSFALLTFENGQLLDLQVQNVYSADGQLKGHVEPPEQIKEVLGEANWYLRDSNWSPHFPKTTDNVEWFLEKELNQTVDGVIGFNLEAAKKIISAFEEIYLADYNEKITADNVFERAEFWSENESFPGSNQKAAFLGLLGQQLFENIKAAEPKEYAKISQNFIEALGEKEVLIYTHNEQLNQTLYQLNWDGSIRNPQCSLNNCFTDYLHINEANLGVNKANYFLRRSIEQGITINSNGKIGHQLKINYENSASSKNWPGGDYIAWVRVYLPMGTEINSISIYNPQNPANKETISEENRQEKVELGKKVVGFKLEVPIQDRQTIDISFTNQTEIKPDNFGYFLYWQKQSGYRNTPLSLLISFPENWGPLQVKPSASIVSGKLLFNQQLNKDLDFGIQFSQ